MLDPLEDLTERVRRTLVPEPPLTVREGGLIAGGFSAELDELRQIAGDGKGWMARFQAEESQRSGIPNLKIGFNSVFGYYLEVPHGQVERVPEHFIRRQTVKGGERYVTPELKEYEGKVLKAEELSRDLEYRLFDELRLWLSGLVGRVLDTARAVAELDVLAALAQLAAERRYVAPAVDRSGEILVREGRHPVIERSSAIERFVPNDTDLGGAAGKIAILTGPNMAGKSTYIRQTALIVLLAQIGSFVPADEARIGVVDRIFTRVGSGDDISRGESTFMVEMVEIANILNNAGPRSLVVLDEVGRGTSTFDGLALAWAIVEHLRDKIGARTLFATHYHQLTQLADRERGVLNLSVAVEERGDEILFLHKIVSGGTDRSYGIHVARLAGVPREVVARARKVLEKIERESEHLAPALARRQAPLAQQLDLFSARESPAEQRLRELDLDRLSPLEALLELKRLKDSLSG
jgi:DNA mismatch repair protein MutS